MKPVQRQQPAQRFTPVWVVLDYQNARPHGSTFENERMNDGMNE